MTRRTRRRLVRLQANCCRCPRTKPKLAKARRQLCWSAVDSCLLQNRPSSWHGLRRPDFAVAAAVAGVVRPKDARIEGSRREKPERRLCGRHQRMERTSPVRCRSGFESVEGDGERRKRQSRRRRRRSWNRGVRNSSEMSGRPTCCCRQVKESRPIAGIRRLPRSQHQSAGTTARLQPATPRSRVAVDDLLLLLLRLPAYRPRQAIWWLGRMPLRRWDHCQKMSRRCCCDGCLQLPSEEGAAARASRRGSGWLRMPRTTRTDGPGRRKSAAEDELERLPRRPSVDVVDRIVVASRGSRADP